MVLLFFHIPLLYRSNTRWGLIVREVYEIPGLKQQSQVGTRVLTISVTLQSSPQTAAALEQRRRISKLQLRAEPQG